MSPFDDVRYLEYVVLRDREMRDPERAMSFDWSTWLCALLRWF